MNPRSAISTALPDRIVVVGAGLAGLRTVERLRRLGHAGSITLIGEEPIAAYDRPPLSKSCLTGEEEPRPPYLRAEDAYAELHVDHRLGRRATALDRTTREVRLDEGSTVSYDALVVATGSRARTVAGWANVPGTLVLRTWDDAVALRRALASVSTAVVIGAGVLGCEIAAAARRHEVSVEVIDVLERPLARVVPPVVGDAIARLHERHGVRFRLGTRVTALSAAGGGPRLELADGAVLSPDLVVIAIGSEPVTDWLEGSGLPVDDGVLCDTEGRTADPNVWAVGDVARVRRLDGSSVRLEHWTAAGDSAGRVATRLLGREPVAATDVPYFWSDQYDAKIQTLGLPAADDELRVVAGDLEEDRFLGVLARDGVVTGAVGIGMPAGVARCRTAVESGEPVSDLLARAPWEPRKVGA